MLFLIAVSAHAGKFDEPLYPYSPHNKEFVDKTELSSPQEKRYELAYYYFLGVYAGGYKSSDLQRYYSLECVNKGSRGHCISAEHVTVEFTEQKTGASHTAMLGGYLESPSTLQRDYAFLGKPYTFTRNYNGTDVGVGIFLDGSEIEKFPSGGVWKARLELPQFDFSGDYRSSSNLSVDITLSLTDSKNIRIWFPQSHTSTTSVALSSRTFHPVTVDACLYDGYNSNSNRLDVMFNSQNAGPDNTFKLVSLSSSGRLRYRVRVAPPDNPGALKEVRPGETVTYTGMNSVQTRQVTMPGLQVPVVCVPWGIELKLLPPPNSLYVMAGHYSDVLTLTLTPSLN